MIIFFYKGLTKNPKIGNTTIWVLPNMWRLGRVRNTRFGMDPSYEILQNTAKCQGYSFYRFWVVNWKPTGAKFISCWKFMTRYMFLHCGGASMYKKSKSQQTRHTKKIVCQNFQFFQHLKITFMCMSFS